MFITQIVLLFKGDMKDISINDDLMLGMVKNEKEDRFQFASGSSKHHNEAASKPMGKTECIGIVIGVFLFLVLICMCRYCGPGAVVEDLEKNTFVVEEVTSQTSLH